MTPGGPPPGDRRPPGDRPLPGDRPRGDRPPGDRLLAGRAAQGCGLALTPLMMAAARSFPGSAQPAAAAPDPAASTLLTAGLFLVPFSVLGFAAGRISPYLRRRRPASALLTASTAVLLAAFPVFAAARGHLAVTPPRETASAMAVNQVVRSIGFLVGSTLSALILAAYTPAGAVFPAARGYTTAAWAGAAITAVALAVGLALGRVQSGEAKAQPSRKQTNCRAGRGAASGRRPG